MANILLVDDEELIRFTLCEVLEAAGHAVVAVKNGAEALQRLAGGAFDIVVTDIVMPVKEGVETIAEIKASYPGLRILAISGGGRLGADGLLDRARSVGADAILRKPFNGEEFLARISAMLDE